MSSQAGQGGQHGNGNGGFLSQVLGCGGIGDKGPVGAIWQAVRGGGNGPSPESTLLGALGQSQPVSYT